MAKIARTNRRRKCGDYFVRVKYAGGMDSALDRRLYRLAGKIPCGSGAYLRGDLMRDLDFDYETLEEAETAYANIRAWAKKARGFGNDIRDIELTCESKRLRAVHWAKARMKRGGAA